MLRKEARISMEKERLVIGMSKVGVEFDFLNESDQNISTDVAFPIPSYSESTALGMEKVPNFPDFKVWVDGKALAYQTELKASLRGKDYSDLLKSMGINIETFGDYEVYDGATQRPDQISKLTRAQKSQLLAAGLIVHDRGEKYLPHWTVTKTYYWKQEFPAHHLVHIKHEYTPVAGAAQIPVRDFDEQTRAFATWLSTPRSSDNDIAEEATRIIQQGCVTSDLQKRLSSDSPSGFTFANYVNYILTSANTWKTPIKDFELIVDYSSLGDGSPVMSSLCWDGPIERMDATHLSLKRRDFVPKKELAVYFFRQ